MENFSAAILSNSASDIPADRLRWLHTTNFFLSLTPSAPREHGICAMGGHEEGAFAASPLLLHTGYLATGKGKGDFYKMGWQELIWPKISSPETDLIWRCLASIRLRQLPPYLVLHTVLRTGTFWKKHQKINKLTKWFPASRSQPPATRTKSRLLNADTEDFLLCISSSFFFFFESFSKLQTVKRLIYSKI